MPLIQSRATAREDVTLLDDGVAPAAVVAAESVAADGRAAVLAVDLALELFLGAAGVAGGGALRPFHGTLIFCGLGGPGRPPPRSPVRTALRVPGRVVRTASAGVSHV